MITYVPTRNSYVHVLDYNPIQSDKTRLNNNIFDMIITANSCFDSLLCSSFRDLIDIVYIENVINDSVCDLYLNDRSTAVATTAESAAVRFRMDATAVVSRCCCLDPDRSKPLLLLLFDDVIVRRCVGSGSIWSCCSVLDRKACCLRFGQKLLLFLR